MNGLINPAGDSPALRTALGRFATGVTIITCVDPAGAPIGLTANSFNALSLDPPLVLWSLRSASPRVGAFVAARHFAVNVLAEDQVAISRRFASPLTDKFDADLWHAGIGDLPLLRACCAIFECETVSYQIEGDHVLFIGRVLRAADSALAPLVFQAGHYRNLGEIV
jgi:3-hydroxy-9,10-secoandrosta-1,3,5(10)-triene-9,17-dione monooxygenase reductase component